MNVQFSFFFISSYCVLLILPTLSLSINNSNSQPNRNIQIPIETRTNKIINDNNNNNINGIKNTSTITKNNYNNNNNNNMSSSSSSSTPSNTSTIKFPTQALLPKAETKADLFLSNYPQYDGRDIIVGILDTGVDPGAIGLSHLPPVSSSSSTGSSTDTTTTSHERKLIHVADCTGSGDVSMSVNAMAVKKEHGWVIDKNILIDDDNDITKIVLNPNLNLQPFPSTNESTDTEDKDTDNEEKEEKEDKHDNDTSTIKMPVRIGYKRLYELYPKKLTTRVKKHSSKVYHEKLHQHTIDINRKLAAFNEKFDTKQPTQEELRDKEDLLARLDVLQGKFDDGNNGSNDPLTKDLGPLCQIILFYDGVDYRVLVNCIDDNSPNFDLTNLPVSAAMTDFYKEGQYGTFSHVDMCNYAINVYEEGKIVSIVVDAGAHGSHVAGITARYQPNSSDRHQDHHNEEANGVAPGAKLISLKIGDSRLGSMETGSALTRALIEAVKHKCDVINLSYGEGCALPNTGRFVELAEELVNKHHIVFVSSAGNNGPALTTVGAPGGTSDAILGVGAYVSPAMMEANYCAPKDDNEGTTYTWSSVGPTADGAQGVDIMAPGAAITCVPNWCLQRNQLMNGTSMSSPNAAGCIALLLSAAKAEGMKVTPARLKRALMNCADNLNGLSPLQQGWGMINVLKTWEYLKQHKDDPHGDINFKVRILGRPGMDRGVYLRQPEETCVKQTFSVDINPVFGTEDNADAELQQQRIDYEMKTSLKATEPWIEVPDFFMLMHNGRSFKFTVDPTKLQPGLHTARILGYDVNNMAFGPRFSVPITVAKSLDQSSSISLGELEFEFNEVKRFFLDVPAGASYMDIKVKDCREQTVDAENSNRMVVLHTIQLLPHNAYRDAQEHKYLNLLPSQEKVTSIPVHQSIACEVALARYWSTQGTTKMNVKVEFHGISASPDELIITAGSGARTKLFSALRNQEIKPEAKLKQWRTPLSPKKSIISPCDERDIIPSSNKQIHQLVLTYEFEQKEEGSFVPRAPTLQGHLYESAFESQIMLIFDEKKNYLGVADSWPSEIQAPKGKITIRMQVRHDDVKKLEQLKEMTIWIERKLGCDIALSAYSSHANMITDGKKMGKTMIRKGTSRSVFFKEPLPSKLPSECKCGDVLIGSVTYDDGKPGGSTIRYIVGTKVESESKSDKAKTPELPDERSIKEKLEEEIRSIKVAQLKKLTDKDEDSKQFEEFYQELLIEYPDHIPLLMAALRFYDKKEKRSDRIEDIISTADLILSKIDEKEIAAHFGMSYDKEDPKSAKERKDMEEKKSFLIEALARKGHAAVTGNEPQQFEELLKELSKWEDIEKNKKYAVLYLAKLKSAKRFGLMLKLLNSLLQKNGDDTKDGIYPLTREDIIKERVAVFKRLNYTELASRDESWLRISKATTDYSLF